jgi:hypothetical protein
MFTQGALEGLEIETNYLADFSLFAVTLHSLEVLSQASLMDKVRAFSQSAACPFSVQTIHRDMLQRV